jgi:hypothetical protein
MRRVAFVFGAVLGLSASAAHATQQGTGALRSWKAMDVCARQAQAAYPEYSADSNAKRDARLKECLKANSLPPRAPLTPPEAR